MDATATVKEISIAKMIFNQGTFSSPITDSRCTINTFAPNITGIDIKNENSTLVLLPKPSIKHADKVTPERDVPGTSART